MGIEIQNRYKEIDKLSEELFFHAISTGDNLPAILKLGEKPLFTLKGRATVSKGGAVHRGMIACYRVPQTEQHNYFTPPYDSGYESWAHGSKEYLALKQTVPDNLLCEVKDWLEIVKGRGGPYRSFDFTRYEDVRYLSSEFFAAGFFLERDFVSQTRNIIRPKKITLTNIGNNSDLSESTLLATMQHYFDEK